MLEKWFKGKLVVLERTERIGSERTTNATTCYWHESRLYCHNIHLLVLSGFTLPQEARLVKLAQAEASLTTKDETNIVFSNLGNSAPPMATSASQPRTVLSGEVLWCKPCSEQDQPVLSANNRNPALFLGGGMDDLLPLSSD